MNPAETLRAQLRAELTPAMRERRLLEVSVLRSLIQAVDNAEAVDAGPTSALPTRFGDGSNEVPRRRLEAGELVALLESEADAREADAAQLAAVGQAERAERLQSEAAFVRSQLGRARALLGES